MQYISRKDQSARELINNSDTSKVMAMVQETIEKTFDEIKNTMQTATDTPIAYQYNVVIQASDVDYGLSSEDDDPENTGEIIHGFSMDNHKGIGMKAMLDSMELFIECFKAKIDTDEDFDDSVPVTKSELTQFVKKLPSLMKALEICAVLEKKNARQTQE